ncbi:hypothetical protein QFW77_01180 [Luteimonas sp. RD2P54]|uniref:Uncharacterized protein n=1 Tax=Luteimonas endophytica TaxID=3042023 RepID=A0ABT6J458_9GAMM|nr:hypothetical protein [Luteimonas endophytica]MDH5821607.1 hypothetical protein [Luteimonas endophytica]
MAGERRGIWIGLAAVVLAGLAAVVGVRMLAPAPSEGTATPPPAVSVPGAEPPPEQRAAPAYEAPPPWLGGPADAEPHTLEQARAQAEQATEQSRRALAELQARSAANEAGIRASIARLDELQAAQGAQAGVNLDALRANLEVALRMQRITQEVQALSLQPSGADRTAAMRAKVDELNQLQGQLRYDIGAQPPAAGNGAE